MYNQTMSEFCPYFTSDGSVGLFNKDYNDIYHSATGALTEAYEKFILPVDFNKLLSKENINVLDICYGIGYNSKVFLNFIFKNFLQKKSILQKDYETIYTNNMSNKKNCYDKIYTDNIFNKISIDAVDNDKILFYLSPFIKTGAKKFKNKNLNFNYPQIKKFLNNKDRKIFPKIDNLINYLILNKIASISPEMCNNNTLNEILNNKAYNQFFDTQMIALYQILKNKEGIFVSGGGKRLNLHNIYYQYLSKHYKKALKRYNLCDMNFNIYATDARQYIKNSNKLYNLIFLDAFTPSKCPCLWSLEFFIELYKHLDQDGILLTYTTAAPVRNAMLQAGFFIGNIYNKRLDKYIGTICSKNKSMIKNQLSEFDFGLLKTKSGIVYHDENLNAPNEAIIERRNFELKNSSLISGSIYKKQFKIL